MIECSNMKLMTKAIPMGNEIESILMTEIGEDEKSAEEKNDGCFKYMIMFE